MANRYREKRDSQGRVRIELTTHQPGVLLCVLAVIPLLVWLQAYPLRWAIPIVAGMYVLVFAWYFVSRKSMRLLINPQARTLAVGAGASARVVKMDDVLQARIDEKQVDARLNDLGTMLNQLERIDYWRRIELVLRSTEIIPLASSHGAFDEEDCQRLVTRIDLAVRRR